MTKKVMVAMSGGVDSSVAAALLKKEGYSITGITMCLGVKQGDDETPSCCGPQAVSDARRVCDMLDIPHYVMDFSEALEKHVIQNFIDEYAAGRTPNPCVRCNRYLKFDILLRKAQALGFDYFSTGHYAGVSDYNGDLVLSRPQDTTKDQTYFLYAVKKEALPRLLFPLASLDKATVRSLARDEGLPVSDKEESQDICFVTGTSYREITGRMLQTTGNIVDCRGTVLGKHRGIGNYTVGQRKGLGIATGTPLYVVKIDPQKNAVIVGSKDDLGARKLVARDLNLFTEKIPPKLAAKIRYAHKAASCELTGHKGDMTVTFDMPQEAITPGQSIVFYDGNCMLGGGIIDKVIP
ncbi:MAG: tRNA 2-thiouridine(34) synthase MnmA [Chitinivibrionales bacterium]|nr:tRNA 2-thiouridine(34) synthase MnmA [Chitinivibrionales bacterium]